MKVFISWSGDLSHKVALALRDWLPSVIQSVEPYVSSEDIDKGARWSSDISGELEKSAFGILCVTNQNLLAPWVHFEAGALSKLVDKSRVAPFLFGLKRSEVKDGPLLQFQSTIEEAEDFRKLIHSLNACCTPQALDDSRLNSIFDVWWPQLASKFTALKASPASDGEAQEDRHKGETGNEILEELLELVRQQHRILSSPTDLLPPKYIASVAREFNEFQIAHPILRDLERHWSQVQIELKVLGEQENVPRKLVEEVLSRLRGPIDYLLRRYGAFPRVRARMVADPAVDDSPP